METSEQTTSRRRVLFTENGKPLPGLPVRLSEDSETIETDDEGQLELPIEEGRGTLQVRHKGEWKEQVVHSGRDSSLVMVDISKTQTGPSLAEADTSFLDIGKLNLGERYVYLEVLGRGGMSIVLKARDRLLNREVAVKLLAQELQGQPEAQEIFLSEARSLATLSHPNLVAVHDICKVDERVFMVIEHVEGKSLEHLVKHVRRLNETVTLQLVIQLCRVVAYLHDHGVIHRDLKPANAMIRHDGTLKLIDFGLARHFDEIEIRGTRVRGTPAYMAPEQIKGDPLTPACDIYQLGVLLFECITGQLPFSSGDLGYAHVHTDPPRLEKHAVGVSLGLADVVHACLEKDPSKRPANGQELLKELQAVYQTLGSQAGGKSLLEQLQSVPSNSRPGDEVPHIPPGLVDERPGYSTSEIGLMERAGKHLRTSELRIKRLSEVALDAESHQQPIIIQQMGPSWQSIALAGLIGALVAGAFTWNHQPTIVTAPYEGATVRERPAPPTLRKNERAVAPEIAPFSPLIDRAEAAPPPPAPAEPVMEPPTAVASRGDATEQRRPVEARAEQAPASPPEPSATPHEAEERPTDHVEEGTEVHEDEVLAEPGEDILELEPLPAPFLKTTDSADRRLLHEGVNDARLTLE